MLKKYIFMHIGQRRSSCELWHSIWQCACVCVRVCVKHSRC